MAIGGPFLTNARREARRIKAKAEMQAERQAAAEERAAQEAANPWTPCLIAASSVIDRCNEVGAGADQLSADLMKLRLELGKLLGVRGRQPIRLLDSLPHLNRRVRLKRKPAKPLPIRSVKP